ncbi:MAG: NADP-dependent oxidoreductase [Gammaproteobacteria bacterium]|nr:MAG: NADP-dependent oxidoreductase [Gammaproteobacteria bacterium]
MSNQNSQVKLINRPVGLPKLSDWDISSAEIPTIEDGQVLIKVLYLSIDPAMRGWMNEGKSYIAPVGIGEVMRAGGIGVVIESKDDAFEVGDHANGMLGVQEYVAIKVSELVKVDANLAPLPLYLSTLGMPGITGYFGLLDTGQPKEGETVVVSGAAGAVGSVVGQIAKIKGCHVVGIAGGEDKCKYLVDELGFDSAIDYKSEDLSKALRTHCPKGIDVFFDNVGGDTLDAVLAQIRFKARIVICGAISQYNNTTAIKGPSNYLSLLVNRARMEGIVVFDNAANYGAAAQQMGAWIAEGKLKSREHIEVGLENFPEVLLKLFRGENFGKLILKVA